MDILVIAKRLYARLRITGATDLLAMIYASAQAAENWN
jgi:hypothetical protein